MVTTPLEHDQGRGSVRPTREPHQRFLLMLLGLGIVLFWLPQLPQSLWVDETVTAWVAQGSFEQMLERSVDFQPTPPTYYIVAWIARGIGGANEIALRIPSLLAMGAATYLLYRLGRKIFDPETGLLASIVMTTSVVGAHVATDARPYGLGVLAFVAATLALIRWFEGRRIRDAFAWVVSAALVVYLSYVLAPALLAHAVFAWRQSRAGADRWMLLRGSLLLAVLLLPLVPHFLTTFDRRDALSLGLGPPGNALLGIAPSSLLVGLALGIAAVAGRMRMATDVPTPRSGALALLWVWAVAPSVILYTLSWVIGAGVFGAQHVTQSMPAVALLVAAGIRRLDPSQVRRLIVVYMAIASLLLGGSVGPFQEDWRGALAYSDRLLGGPEAPVLVRPMLAESSMPDWFADPDRATYLLAPAHVYPTKGAPVLLPFGLSTAERGYLETEVIPIATSVSRVPVVSLSYDDEVLPWVSGRLRAEGFELTERLEFGSVVVAVFERPEG